MDLLTASSVASASASYLTQLLTFFPNRGVSPTRDFPLFELSILREPEVPAVVEYERIAPTTLKNIGPNFIRSMVFVHGLGGHSRDTWGGWNAHWPCDFLPKDLKGVRVLAFNYDARLSSLSDNLGVFEGIGKILLHFCHRIRLDVSVQDRPIIFVCHGLGGLIVKSVRL